MTVRSARIILIVLICVLALAPLGLAGAAQTPPVSLTVHAGLDGMAESESWSPIRVDVANNGPDLKVQIVLAEPRAPVGDIVRYTRSLDLPRQSHKQVFVYWWAGYASNVKVQLVAGNRVLAQELVTIKGFGAGVRLNAVLSSAPASLAWLPVMRTPGQAQPVAQLGVEDIPPQPQALASLDALIVLDADTNQLVQPQRDALRQWVEEGGTLIVTGGSHWQKNTAGLADLLPVAVSDARTMDRLDALAAAGGRTLAGPVLVAQGALREGVVSLAQDNLPLIARRDMGDGRVYFIAWDPAAEPMASWSGSAALLSSILEGAITPRPMANVVSNSDTSTALGALAGAGLPPTWQICGFLLLYVLIIGPINYAALHRLKRRELAWLTVPVISLAFSACAYLIGFQSRGPWVTLHRLVMVQGQAGQAVGRADVLLGVFSPHRGTYDVQIGPDPALQDAQVLAQPLSSRGTASDPNVAVIEQGSPLTLRRVKVDVGAIESFAASLPAPLPRISADLVLDIASDTASLSGEIRNESDADLHNAVILVGDAALPIDTLKARQAISTKWSLNRWTWSAGNSTRTNPGGSNDLAYVILGSHNTYSDLEARRRTAMLHALLPGTRQGELFTGIYLAGWTSHAPLTTALRGGTAQEVDDVFYLIRLPFRANPLPPGPFALAPGLMISQMTSSSNSSLDFPVRLSSNQSVAFRLRPWPQVTVGQVTGITMSVAASGSSYDLQVYNRRTDQWNMITIPSSGLIELPNTENSYVGPDNVLDVRVVATGSSVTVNSMWASLEGER